jgi:hypothetical protein
MRRLALGLILALLLVGAPSAAHAGAVHKLDRGGVKAKGLSRAQRAALDIKRVSAVGGSFGLVVSVRFKGNVQGLLGRGRLGRAAVALVLRPKRGRGSPAVLATTGRGKRARTLRRTRTKQVEVVRLGRELRFYVLGTGVSNLRRLQVKSFARLGRGARASDNEIVLDKALYDKIVNSEGSDQINLGPPSAAEACKELRAQIHGLVSAGQGSATTELAAALLAHGCATDLQLLSIGYQHVASGESLVCADLSLDPDLIPGLNNFAAELFDSANMRLTERFFRSDFDSNGKLRAVFKISKGGKYTLRAGENDVEDESAVGIRDITKEVEVLEPPSPSTKECKPPS